MTERPKPGTTIPIPVSIRGVFVPRCVTIPILYVILQLLQSDTAAKPPGSAPFKPIVIISISRKCFPSAHNGRLRRNNKYEMSV